MSDSSQHHGLQSTRLLRPRDSPGKSTGVGCHCLLRRYQYYVSNIVVMFLFEFICILENYVLTSHIILFSVMNYFYIIMRKKEKLILKYVETNALNKVVKLLKINL